MSRTTKAGKRGRQVRVKPADPAVGNAVHMRHIYGSTEKILRRNRKTWTRLANKRRRQVDKVETKG